MKSTKWLAHDVIDTHAAHASLVHDVKDKDCRTQNGSVHGRVFATFKRRFLINWTINRPKNYIEPPPPPPLISIDSYCDTTSPGVLFKITRQVKNLSNSTSPWGPIWDRILLGEKGGNCMEPLYLFQLNTRLPPLPN